MANHVRLSNSTLTSLFRWVPGLSLMLPPASGSGPPQRLLEYIIKGITLTPGPYPGHPLLWKALQ